MLEIYCRGLTIAEVAAELKRSRHTVKAHMARIYSFYNVRNRVELMNMVGIQPSVFVTDGRQDRTLHERLASVEEKLDLVISLLRPAA